MKTVFKMVNTQAKKLSGIAFIFKEIRISIMRHQFVSIKIIIN